MKKTIMFLGVLSLGLAQAQQEGRVGINTDEPKATLQVKSTSPDEAKGVLIPQLTGDKLREMTTNLAADQHGLITFATDGVTALDNVPTNNVQFAGYHRFNVDGSNKSWVRLEPSGLEKIKGERDKIGWALVGRDTTKYGKIGNWAIDMSTGGSPVEFEGKIYDRGATGNYSFAAGIGTVAYEYGSVALGQNNIAGHVQAVAMGWNTKALGIRSVAMGNFTEALGHSSVALGYNTHARYDRSMAFGTYNTIENPNNDENIKTRRIFVLGNGAGKPIPDGSEVRSDAFTVLYNGKTGIDIDNFEATPSNAKLQVNGAIKVDSNTETLICNEHNAGTMSYKEVKGSGVFGFCMKKETGEYVWAYLKGAHLHGESTNRGAFGSGL